MSEPTNGQHSVTVTLRAPETFEEHREVYSVSEVTRDV